MTNNTDSVARIMAMAALGRTALSEPITVEYAIGGIAVGDVIPAGTTIEEIIRMIFTNGIIEEDMDIYYGASTKVPTNLENLIPVTKSIAILISKGMVQNIHSGDVPTTTPQYTVIACKNTLELRDWKNKVTHISYMGSVHKVVFNDYNIYYKEPVCFDADIGGEEYKFEFKEAGK